MTIKQLRQRVGTQEEVANILGFSDKTAISKWESGKTMPKTKDLPRIAEVFGVSLLDLLEALAASRQVEEESKKCE